MLGIFEPSGPMMIESLPIASNTLAGQTISDHGETGEANLSSGNLQNASNFL